MRHLEVALQISTIRHDALTKRMEQMLGSFTLLDRNFAHFINEHYYYTKDLEWRAPHCQCDRREGFLGASVMDSFPELRFGLGGWYRADDLRPSTPLPTGPTSPSPVPPLIPDNSPTIASSPLPITSSSDDEDSFTSCSPAESNSSPETASEVSDGGSDSEYGEEVWATSGLRYSAGGV